MRDKFLKVAEWAADVAGRLVYAVKNPSADVLGIIGVFFAWRGFGAIYSPLGLLALAAAFIFAAWMHRR